MINNKKEIIKLYNNNFINKEINNINKLNLGFVNNDINNSIIYNMLLHCIENVEIFTDVQNNNINNIINVLSYEK